MYMLQLLRSLLSRPQNTTATASAWLLGSRNASLPFQRPGSVLCLGHRPLPPASTHRLPCRGRLHFTPAQSRTCLQTLSTLICAAPASTSAGGRGCGSANPRQHSARRKMQRNQCAHLLCGAPTEQTVPCAGQLASPPQGPRTVVVWRWPGCMPPPAALSIIA